ncbi:MAG TPA: Crp/Fnr family transcriptional regulator [Burkholderiaceae bacterium]
MLTNTALAAFRSLPPANATGDRPRARPPVPATRRRIGMEDAADARQTIEQLALIERSVPLQRRVLRAGDSVHQAGQRFTHLYVANAGVFKIVNLTRDGREQIVSLKFRGDWLGLDGIADGAHDCEAVALDTCEVWAIPYAALLQSCASTPALMSAFHEAMSREIARDRISLMSVCTLPADARVAEFLRDWTLALARGGLRTDQITMRMTRAEIGSYLGLTLESVSRALSRMAREALIRFADNGRRELQIPDVAALGSFVERCLAPEAVFH